MHIALVNTNRIMPPIAPIGLDYVAEALHAAGHSATVLDLCWADDPGAAIAGFFDRTHAGLVGVTLRNTDDCAFSSRESFLGGFADTVKAIRAHTDAPIVAGGVGFSVMPEQILALCGADAGIWGEGEFTFPALADRIERGREWHDLPNLVRRGNGGWQRNPPSNPALADLPPMGRRWVDNPRYFREGGQIGFETKRGCSGQCVYCADPVAKGNRARTRPPEAVADELEGLLDMGVDHFHTCDGEFNLPARHALSVCEEMARRNMDDRSRWYAYCSAAPFSRELAGAMRRAGCVGINFGVDNGDAEMLRRLKRNFTPEDILNAAQFCREAGIATMFDLLLGSPGETEESLVRTIDLMRQAEPDRVGVAVGVRVYPGTALADRLTQGDLTEGLTGGDGTSDPLFFVEPAVGSSIFNLLDGLIGDDRRFFFFDPTRPDRNYNYNANQVLVDAIRDGHRGAYWDILRKCG